MNTSVFNYTMLLITSSVCSHCQCRRYQPRRCMIKLSFQPLLISLHSSSEAPRLLRKSSTSAGYGLGRLNLPLIGVTCIVGPSNPSLRFNVLESNELKWSSISLVAVLSVIAISLTSNRIGISQSLCVAATSYNEPHIN